MTEGKSVIVIPFSDDAVRQVEFRVFPAMPSTVKDWAQLKRYAERQELYLGYYPKERCITISRLRDDGSRQPIGIAFNTTRQLANRIAHELNLDRHLSNSHSERWEAE